MTYSKYPCCNVGVFLYHNDANNTLYGTPSNSYTPYSERFLVQAHGTYSYVDAYINITVLHNSGPYWSGSSSYMY